jgi:divalent metal cation (Fe/Co/Zn/Cd) transporter
MSTHDHEHSHPKISSSRRAILVRRIKFLVIFTISYNVIEAAVALIAGNIAGSIALIGFGLDSVIEVSSALAVAWQFAGKDPERREKIAFRIISVSFFGLAAFVSFDAVKSLLLHEAPENSLVGVIVAVMSLLIMPGVSLFQRKTGLELGSHSAVADSKQTLLCTYMSGVLLIGLAANGLFDWWWADPIAALIIAGLAVHEGIEAWKGENCSSAELLYERNN